MGGSLYLPVVSIPCYIFDPKDSGKTLQICWVLPIDSQNKCQQNSSEYSIISLTMTMISRVGQGYSRVIELSLLPILLASGGSMWQWWWAIIIIMMISIVSIRTIMIMIIMMHVIIDPFDHDGNADDLLKIGLIKRKRQSLDSVKMEVCVAFLCCNWQYLCVVASFTAAGLLLYLPN